MGQPHLTPRRLQLNPPPAPNEEQTCYSQRGEIELQILENISCQFTCPEIPRPRLPLGPGLAESRVALLPPNILLRALGSVLWGLRIFIPPPEMGSNA